MMNPDPFTKQGKALLCDVCEMIVEKWLESSSDFVTNSICERFEPRSHFKSRLSLIVRVNVVLNRTVVVDSD